MSITIQPATPDDIPAILALIRELAEYEKLSDLVSATVESLRRDLFGPRPYAEVLMGRLNGQPVGYALFFHSYSTFLVMMPVLGFGLFGSLSGIIVYGPEIFPPSARATGMAVANGVGRYITAAGPMIAGVIAASWFGGDLGLATTCVAAFGLIALVGLAFAPETKGAALPTDPGVTVVPPAAPTPVEAAATSQEHTS